MNPDHNGYRGNTSASCGDQNTVKTTWFVRGDIDGFFGLFIDNLLQLMVIATLGAAVCGFDSNLIHRRILPGAAVSILVGNLFYAWQARKLALKSGQKNVTALPFGINTPSVIAYIFLIMGPVYQETHNATLAWQAGLFACFMSGVMETAGAFVGDWLRRHTPRAALLSALAGIAITFIAMGFVFQIFASPVIAIVPMLLILINYASGIKLPFRIPGGFLAVAIGTMAAWIAKSLGYGTFHPAPETYEFQVCLPQSSVTDLFGFLSSPMGWKYFAVIFPMGLFNVIGSLQNLESAEAAGDRFETRSSLLANGLGTIVASFLGSAFPTTIYIGHPGWKAMGARWGYSILNGTVIAILCLFGGVTLVMQFIPIEATLGILLWIGLIISAQAFQESPKKHALAVVMGFIPSLAAWALVLVETAIRTAGSNLFEIAPKFGSDLYIHGLIALSQGFILTSMVLSAILAFIIDREFLKAAYWTLSAAACSATGLMHAYTLTPQGVKNKFGWMAAPDFFAAYLIAAAILFGLHFWWKKQPGDSEPPATGDDFYTAC